MNGVLVFCIFRDMFHREDLTPFIDATTGLKTMCKIKMLRHWMILLSWLSFDSSSPITSLVDSSTE